MVLAQGSGTLPLARYLEIVTRYGFPIRDGRSVQTMCPCRMFDPIVQRVVLERVESRESTYELAVDMPLPTPEPSRAP